MKEKIITILTVWAVLYLVGAFVEASFNITHWGESDRTLIAFIGVCFGFGVMQQTNE